VESQKGASAIALVESLTANRQGQQNPSNYRLSAVATEATVVRKHFKMTEATGWSFDAGASPIRAEESSGSYTLEVRAPRRKLTEGGRAAVAAPATVHHTIASDAESLGQADSDEELEDMEVLQAKLATQLAIQEEARQRARTAKLQQRIALASTTASKTGSVSSGDGGRKALLVQQFQPVIEFHKADEHIEDDTSKEQSTIMYEPGVEQFTAIPGGSNPAPSANALPGGSDPAPLANAIP